MIIVIGAYSDLGTSEARAGIETDTVTTSTTVNLDLSGIGLEALSSIFGGDTTLDSETTLGDSILGQTKLRQSGTGGNLNLSSNDINSSDFLCGKRIREIGCDIPRMGYVNIKTYQ